jgi:hypothetical protein
VVSNATRTCTPPTVTKQLLSLANKLAPAQSPVYLVVQPEADAKINECFPNVVAKVQKDGGSIVFGWQLWEWPHVLIEAEFHAVWRSPEGELKEISPKQHGEEKILFLPDAKRVYRGVSIDNVRIALRDDLLVQHFIAVSEEIVKVMNSGERAHQHGYVSIPAREIEPLLEMQGLIQSMLTQGLRAHDLCLCGSGNKYKRCHGRAFSR